MVETGGGNVEVVALHYVPSALPGTTLAGNVGEFTSARKGHTGEIALDLLQALCNHNLIRNRQKNRADKGAFGESQGDPRDRRHDKLGDFSEHELLATARAPRSQNRSC